MTYKRIKSLIIPSSNLIDEENPWSDDQLGAETYADSLTEYINTWGSQRLIMSVRGAWGSGKTFMLRRWHQELINEGYMAVYINAWQDDFQEPLVAIVEQVDRQIVQLLRQSSSNTTSKKKW